MAAARFRNGKAAPQGAWRNSVAAGYLHAQLAPYDPQTRQAMIRREVDEHVWRFASAMLNINLKPPRKGPTNR